MATINLLRTALFVSIISVAFSCKKQDRGELDKTGASSNEPAESRGGDTTVIVQDTIGAAKDGINGSGIGAGEPNDN